MADCAHPREGADSDDDDPEQPRRSRPDLTGGPDAAPRDEDGGRGRNGGGHRRLGGGTSACSSDEEAEPTKDSSLPASDVPVGSGTVIEDTYVITQPKEGEFFAFSSVCTHQGCQVTRITEEAIICPCHSSNFSVTTGEVVSGPAEEPLPKYEVSESGGTLTVTGK